MIAKADNIGALLDTRRKDLGMSIRILATRCGLGVATVHRALAGKVSERLETVSAIAAELGLRIDIRPIMGAKSLRREVARRKAQAIVGSAQGNFALEAQAVPDAQRQRIEGAIRKKLLNGPSIRLWSQ